MAKQLMCPKCKGTELQIQLVNAGEKSKSKHSGVGLGGHAYNATRGMMALGTLGLSNLVMPKAKGQSKTVTKGKVEKMCICQTCGHSWKIK